VTQSLSYSPWSHCSSSNRTLLSIQKILSRPSRIPGSDEDTPTTRLTGIDSSRRESSVNLSVYPRPIHSPTTSCKITAGILQSTRAKSIHDNSPGLQVAESSWSSCQLNFGWREEVQECRIAGEEEEESFLSANAVPDFSNTFRVCRSRTFINIRFRRYPNNTLRRTQLYMISRR
jgi:hypothetical protein